MERLTFKHLQTLYSAWTFDVSRNEAELRVVDAEVVAALGVVLNDAYAEDTGLTVIAGDPGKPLNGQVFRFSVAAPRVGLGIFAPSVDALLQDRRVRVAEPARYFVVNSEAPNVKDLLDRYRAVISLVKLLAESAAYLDRDHAELVFISAGKVVIPVDYKVEDLDCVDLSATSSIIAAFGPDLHRDQKLAILAESVIELVIALPAVERFATLIRKIPQLQKRFAQGYRLFASSFSYDKIRSEVEEARLKFTGKIHEALSGIQSQLLSIPVATVVVATQLRPTDTVDAIFWGNIAVLFGVWVFALLVNLLVRNQQKTLAVLEAEISRQQTTMKSLYSDTATLFDEVFKSLHDRARRQQNVLSAVCIVVFIGLAVAHAVFLAVTTPAWNWLVAWWS